MRYALFSDVHGNIYAFEAMMNALRHEKIDGYLFCGDLTGYYYHAREIIDEVKQLPNFYAVCGNHDKLFLDALADNVTKYEATKMYGQSYQNVDIEIAKYIRTLPEVIHLNLGNFRIAVVHGSLASPLMGRIYPDTVLDMPPPEYDFLFVGHTHYQMTRIHSNSCKIINPGSLGQPRDGNGFSYCIVDFVTGEVERRLINFDLLPLRKEISEKDPEIHYLVDVLKRNKCKN